MTADLAGFLLAQLDAEEAWLAGRNGEYMDDCQECAVAQQPGSPISRKLLLDRIAALRAVVRRYEWSIKYEGYESGLHFALRVLAQPYRGRPGWRDEWGTG